jgi:saccharopine dehydrogenase-like NADP-dependent oxidoreductase
MSDQAMKRVVILGGTGIFGSRIAAGLAETPSIAVALASRNPERAAKLANRIGAKTIACDAGDSQSLKAVLREADLLIHAAGPFQGNDYRVAQACVEAGVQLR